MRYVDAVAPITALLLMVGLTACGGIPAQPGVAGPGGGGRAERTGDEAGVNAGVRKEFEQALAAMKAGRNRDAERRLVAMVSANPDLSGPAANLGIIYYRLGELGKAEDALAKAVALNPRVASYHNQLGIVYRANGQFSEARRAYEKALQLDPNYAYAHLNIGILYDIYLRDADKALHHYQRYQQLLTREDQQVSKWIVDLKQRSQAAGKT